MNSSLKAKCILESYASMDWMEQYNLIVTMMKDAHIESMVCVTRQEDDNAVAQTDERILKQRVDMWLLPCIGQQHIALQSTHTKACFSLFSFLAAKTIGHVKIGDGTAEYVGIYMTHMDEGEDFETDEERRQFFFYTVVTTVCPYMISLTMSLPTSIWVMSLDSVFRNVYAQKGNLSTLMHLFGYPVRAVKCDETADGISRDPAAVERMQKLYPGLHIMNK